MIHVRVCVGTFYEDGYRMRVVYFFNKRVFIFSLRYLRAIVIICT